MTLWLERRIDVSTAGRGTYDVTGRVQQAVSESGIDVGLCHLFIRHTSASLIICENADPRVRDDLEAFMAREVPDGDPIFSHTQEGPDDMPAHVRSVLTSTSVSVPVSGGRLHLGTWQGIYLWEHRSAPHERTVVATMYGNPHA